MIKRHRKLKKQIKKEIKKEPCPIEQFFLEDSIQILNRAAKKAYRVPNGIVLEIDGKGSLIPVRKTRYVFDGIRVIRK